MLDGRNWWSKDMNNQYNVVVDSPNADLIEQQLVLSPSTKAVCSGCGREDGHTLFVKRQGGKYILLCKQVDGSGCYPQHHRTLCCHIGADTEQCMQLAEWRVEFIEGTKSFECCSDHLGRISGMFATHTRKVYSLE